MNMSGATALTDIKTAQIPSPKTPTAFLGRDPGNGQRATIIPIL